MSRGKYPPLRTPDHGSQILGDGNIGPTSKYPSAPINTCNPAGTLRKQHYLDSFQLSRYRIAQVRHDLSSKPNQFSAVVHCAHHPSAPPFVVRCRVPTRYSINPPVVRSTAPAFGIALSRLLTIEPHFLLKRSTFAVSIYFAASGPFIYFVICVDLAQRKLRILPTVPIVFFI